LCFRNENQTSKISHQINIASAIGFQKRSSNFRLWISIVSNYPRFSVPFAINVHQKVFLISWCWM
jgi:hypothetical protein